MVSSLFFLSPLSTLDYMTGVCGKYFNKCPYNYDTGSTVVLSTCFLLQFYVKHLLQLVYPFILTSQQVMILCVTIALLLLPFYSGRCPLRLAASVIVIIAVFGGAGNSLPQRLCQPYGLRHKQDAELYSIVLVRCRLHNLLMSMKLDDGSFIQSSSGKQLLRNADLSQFYYLLVYLLPSMYTAYKYYIL